MMIMSVLRIAFEIKPSKCRISRYFCGWNSLHSRKNRFSTSSTVFQSAWKTYLANVTKTYEQVLEKHFPLVYKIYRLFIVGSRMFYQDTKEYLRIKREISKGKNIRSLSRRDIEIYFDMPKILLRVVPVVVVASLPFTSYFIFPLIYLFPRQLLSNHFWTLQQRVDFALLYHKKRLYNNKPVFRNLQATLVNIQNPQLRDSCQNIFHKLGSGVHPTVEEILSAKDAFSVNPYKLTTLSAGHVTSLCSMHGLSVMGFRKRNLKNHAEMIQHMDFVLKKDVRSLNADDMRKACFLRGVNPIGMQRDDIIRYLEQWMSITDHVNNENVSLLLHCPIFLAYNQPTNWSLIHPVK